LIGQNNIPFPACKEVQITLVYKAVGYVQWTEELPQWGGGGVGVEFYDADGYLLEWGWQDFLDTGGEWATFPPSHILYEDWGTWWAPEGTATVEIQIKNWGGNGASTTTYIDDVTLIPEPATIAMLGLGGLALIRRKRA
jgi:hypothetical protein